MKQCDYQNISIGQLAQVAASIIENFQSFRILAFYGEMGVGKTTLIKEICKYLGSKDALSSPTFSLVNEYFSPEFGNIYHFDFYRILDESEAMDIGLEEYLYSGDYCLIEWPEKISTLLPKDHLKITLSIAEKNNRNINLRTS